MVIIYIFEAESILPDVASVTVKGSKLHIFTKSYGNTTITVSAFDNSGGLAKQSFNVAVDPPGGASVDLIKPLDDLNFYDQSGNHSINLMQHFASRDKELLKFGFEITDMRHGLNLTALLITIIIALMLITSLILLLQNNATIKITPVYPFRILTEFVKKTPWTSIILLVFSSTIIILTVRTVACVFYFKYFIESMTLASSYVFIGGLLFFLGFYFSKKHLSGLNNEIVLYVLFACMMVSTTFQYYVYPGDHLWIMLIQVLVSICNGAAIWTSWEMLRNHFLTHGIKRQAEGSLLYYLFNWGMQKISLGIVAAVVLITFLPAKFPALFLMKDNGFEGVKKMVSIYPALIALVSIILMLSYTFHKKQQNASLEDNVEEKQFNFKKDFSNEMSM